MPAPKVLFFGDSRAADWTLLDLPQFTFANRGVGGQTSAEALAYIDMALIGERPQIVVVQIGINDLSVLSFSPRQQTQIVDNCKHNIRQIVARLSELVETVVLTTIFPVGDAEMLFFDTAVVVEAVDEVNRTLHTLTGPKVVIFDTYAILAADDGLVQPDYALDMLHLNRQGYAALNQALADVLTGLAAP